MTTRPDARRDIIVGAGLCLFAAVLFVVHIGRPAGLMFDETHYVPAARALLARTAGVNIEHPLFAKTLIAGGMLVWGDNAYGWRLPGALCGVAGIAAVYWIARQLLHDRRSAVCAALLVTFNQTYFIQARIGMLEMPMTAALLVAGGCLLHGSREAPGARGWRMAGAVALGLATGAKWLAAPYVVLFLMLSGWARWQARDRDRAFLAGQVLPDTLKLAGISGLVYLATFWPAFFYRDNPVSVFSLVGFQWQMLAAQRAPIAPHPYQSDWWQWPLMLRPIWYLFARNGAAYQAVLLVGNPVVYWGGLAMVLAVLSGWIRRRPPAVLLTVGIYLFSVLIWVVIPKPIGFFYYYNLSAIALCLVIAAGFDAPGSRGRGALVWLTAASAAMFVYFYPVISAQPLPADNGWTRWVWMKSWY